MTGYYYWMMIEDIAWGRYQDACCASDEPMAARWYRRFKRLEAARAARA